MSVRVKGRLSVRRTTLTAGTVLLLVASTVGGCTGSPFGVGGSGDVVSESRDVSGFDEIALEGTGIVNVEVTGTESITIEAEDNLLPYLTTDVRGGRLELGTSRSIRPTRDIVYTITVISLEGVSVSGSGEINAVGVEGNRFEANISGSGAVLVPDAEVASVLVNISGSGVMEISGNANDLELSISGSGRYAGERLTLETGDVAISGSGQAVVNVTDDLHAEISGSGHLEYIGDPHLDASTSGSGSVTGR